MVELYKAKTYTHFDYKLRFNKVENYVYGFKNNPKHSFLPLVYGMMTIEKFVDLTSFDKDDYSYRMNKNGIETKVPTKVKERPIMYASHLDNYIYKHYGLEINDLYNKYLVQNNFNDSSVAYRSNKKGKCNVDFAAEAINFINEHDDCFVYVGDFSSFFDTLNHNYLKNMIRKLYPNGEIPEHQYRIFKSLTKHSYIDRKDINYYTSEKRKIYQRGNQRFFRNMKDFRKFKTDNTIVRKNREKNNLKFKGFSKNKHVNKKSKSNKKYYKSVSNQKNYAFKRKEVPKAKVLKVNRNNYGIPQGTAISAIYSNIYMMDIDKMITDLVSTYSGLYRRYSDDYIIVLPNISTDEFNELKHVVEMKMRIEAKLKIHPKKTQVMVFKDKKLINFYTKKPAILDYLGFTFDGDEVKMREKSIYNYYRTAYELIKKGVVISMKKFHVGPKARLTYKRKLYQKYHLFGERTDIKYGYKERPYGTFITYAYKSQKIFEKTSSNTNNLMTKQIEAHQRKLKKKIYDAESYLRSLTKEEVIRKL
ncbi:reverse transcriptase domain-containing protein [Vagococcus carniphilus]|uniref:reverse transcriptase domain-containing protein n=1 Tax=Vagococcus carniphilus TaxID=218144 RepID=UPI003BAAF1D7